MNKLCIVVFAALMSVGCGDDEAGNAGPQCSLDPPSCPYGTYCRIGVNNTIECVRAPAPDAPTGDAGSPNEPILDGATGEPPITPDASEMLPNDAGVPVNDAGTVMPNACGDIRILLKPSVGATARVMLVVDRSYSMVESEDRWSPITEALIQVTRALEGTVEFGLVTFPDPSPGQIPPGVVEACVPGRVQVSPDFDTAAQIENMLEVSEPRFGQGTPTTSALEAAGVELSRQPSPSDFILLATDGGPGCNQGLDPQRCTCLNSSCVLFDMAENCLDDARTIETVRRLREDNEIRTFVLGLTSENFLPEARQVLDDMAVAGGTDQEGRHFEVVSTAALQQKIIETAGSVAPCIYALGAAAEFADQLEVRVDGTVVPRDPTRTNGWDLSGVDIEFFGAACSDLRDGRAHEIQAVCPE